MKSYFIIIEVIFWSLRSFVVRAFSNSIWPLCLAYLGKMADFILVNKFDYGLRCLVLNTTIISDYSA